MKDIPICTIHKTYLATYCPHCVEERNGLNGIPCPSNAAKDAEIKRLRDELNIALAYGVSEHNAAREKELEQKQRSCDVIVKEYAAKDAEIKRLREIIGMTESCIYSMVIKASDANDYARNIQKGLTEEIGKMDELRRMAKEG